jgi:hypothetical protein
MAFVLKLVFLACLVTWAVGGLWIMTSGGALTFGMTSEQAVIIHRAAAVLTVALGLVLLVRWIWIKLYS